MGDSKRMDLAGIAGAHAHEASAVVTEADFLRAEMIVVDVESQDIPSGAAVGGLGQKKIVIGILGLHRDVACGRGEKLIVMKEQCRLRDCRRRAESLTLTGTAPINESHPIHVKLDADAPNG